MVRRLLACVFGLGLLVGCATDVELSLSIEDPCNQSILAQTAYLEVSVSSASTGYGQSETWSASAAGGELPAIPLMDDAVVSVIAREAQGGGEPGAAIAAATVGGVDLSGTSGQLTLPLSLTLGKIDTFVNTSADKSSCTELIADRRDHTATKLDDGRVLVVGGVRESGTSATFWATTELFDPQAGSFTAGPELAAGGLRRGHRATTLEDRRILFTGGKWRYQDQGTGTISEQVWRPALVFDPALDDGHGAFAEPIVMRDARVYHTATLLPDGRVLLAGGECDSEAIPPERDPDDPCNATEPEVACVDGFSRTTEIFDPTSGQSTCGPVLATGRASHAAVKVGTDSVVLIGGRDASGALATIEFVTVGDEGSQVATAQLAVGRSHSVAAMVPNQNAVVIVGGVTDRDDGFPLGAPEQSTGLASIELLTLNRSNLEASTMSCGEAGLELIEARGDPGFAMVSGRLLVAGGIGDTGSVVRSAEVLTFGNLSSCALTSQETSQGLATGRSGAVLTSMIGGDVLVTGGINFNDGQIGTVASSEIYTVER